MDAVAHGEGGRERALRDPAFLAVCFAIATLPLEISGLWFPTTLINLSRIGMVVAIAVVLVRLARERQFSHALSPGLVAATGLVLAVDLVSLLLTRWPGALRQMVPFVFYALFAVAVAETLTDTRRIRIAASVFLAAASVEAAIVLAQQAGNFYITQIRPLVGRRNGTFIEPNITARYLVIALVVALGAARAGRSLPIQLVVALPALFALALVLTFSRTGWVLLVLVVIVSIALDVRNARARVAAAAAIGAFVLGIALVPSALHRATDIPAPADQEGSSLARRTASLVVAAPPPVDPVAAAPSTPLDGILAAAPIDPVRRYLARAAVAMFVDHPLMGVGLAGFQPMILTRYVDYVIVDYRSAPVSAAHTDVLRIAAEEGLVGLAALVVFAFAIVLALRRALRGADDIRRIGLQAAGLTILVVFLAAQTEGRFYNDGQLWLAIGVIGALGYHRDASPSH